MDLAPSRLGNFVLVRLSASGNPPSRTVLDQTLKPYFSCRLGLSDGQWRKLLANTLDELAGMGFIEQRPYRLSPAGWAALKDFLEIDELPTDLKWLSLRNRYLLAKALDILPASPAQLKRLATSDGIRAAVLVKHYKLPIEPLPTLEHALDVLAEQELRPEIQRDSTGTMVMERDDRLRLALIPNQPGELKVCLPAFVMKARNNSVESLRQAVINRWLNGCDANEYKFLMPGAAEEDTGESSSHLDGEFDLRTFASRIRDLAGRAETAQFGGNKVFLSHLWESYRAESECNGMTRRQFNEYLLEANRQNLITLSRADLISELDPETVEASEIALPHATFHFLRTDVAHRETQYG